MAKVKSFRAESGVSFQDKKDNWYKLACAIEVEVEDGDDLEEVKEKAWNTVHSECEKQVMEILSVDK